MIFQPRRNALSANGCSIRLTTAENRLLLHFLSRPWMVSPTGRDRGGHLRSVPAHHRSRDRCRRDAIAQEADLFAGASRRRPDQDGIPPRLHVRQRRLPSLTDGRRRAGRLLMADPLAQALRGGPMDALTPHSLEAPVEAAIGAAGSLLGTLVIVARHRGIHLAVPQLVHDHLLPPGEPAVSRLIGIARLSGLRATAATLSWRRSDALGKTLPAIVLPAEWRRHGAGRVDAGRHSAACGPAGPERATRTRC